MRQCVFFFFPLLFFFFTPQPVSAVHGYSTTPVGRISFSRRVFICKSRFSYGMRRRADLPHFKTFSSFFLLRFLLLLSLRLLLLLLLLMIHSPEKVEELESSAKYSYSTIPSTPLLHHHHRQHHLFLRVCLSLNTVSRRGGTWLSHGPDETRERVGKYINVCI